MDLIEQMDKSLLPFYDEVVRVELKDGKLQPLHVCVFQDYDDDAFTDAGLDSDRETLSFNFLRKDWCYVSRLKRGDRIYRDRLDKEYTVVKVVEDFALGGIVKAR